jgi:DNA-binding response OmpR family regulator
VHVVAETMKRKRPPLAGRTVLVVEDDFLVGQDLRSLLEAAGAAAVGPVDDISAACAIARNGSIDGALLDVRLWDQTAAPVAVELAQRDVPFIVVSGYPEQEMPPAMRGAAYLAKPVQRMELIRLAQSLFPPARKPTRVDLLRTAQRSGVREARRSG